MKIVYSRSPGSQNSLSGVEMNKNYSKKIGATRARQQVQHFDLNCLLANG
jgi:hypothetical protein